MHTPTLVSTAAFPSIAVESQLRAALIDAAAREALFHGIAISQSGQAPINALAIDIDSLEVVDLICDLDGVMGFEIGEGVVRAGGYSSVDDALADLMPKLQKAWQKYHRGKK
jgi:hypothetical protein